MNWMTPWHSVQYPRLVCELWVPMPGHISEPHSFCLGYSQYISWSLFHGVIIVKNWWVMYAVREWKVST
jgi:hypothetical protein